MLYKSKRQQYELIRAQLDAERSTFLPSWRELSEFILPRRARFFTSDSNKGDRRNQKIIDSTGTLAARTLRSGLMSGITSPARPWFRLTTPDPGLAEQASVKQWLSYVTARMNVAFLRSNLYNILPTAYGDLGVFGTSPIILEEDFDNVIHCQSMPVGSYMIGTNDKGRVNVFFREFRMSVRQLIEMFGERDEKTGKPDWSRFSMQVRNHYDSGNYEAWIDVCHIIKPNESYDDRKLLAKFKKFTSCYYEKGVSGSASNSDDDVFLRESGYDLFPVLCPRWEVTGEDVYGTNCPGMEAIGDIKQLQTGERRTLQAIDKMVNPPMVGPTSMRNSKASILPGDISFVDVREGQGGFRPAHELNFRINEMEQKQQEVRNRIRRCFFEDLFLMLAQSDRRQITAREIDERHEEKLLALGPVLEQLNQDLLDPLIDNTFSIMMNQGLIPPPPEEIQGQDLKVDYISVMAQAQKLNGVQSVERFAGFVAQAANISPDVLDKVDVDQMIDVYGDMLSMQPNVVRTDEAVAEIRAQKQQAAQQQAQAEQMQQTAAAAKNLSETDLEGDNALNRLMQSQGVA